MQTCKTCVFWHAYQYMHKPAFHACEVAGTPQAVRAETLFDVTVEVSDDSGLLVHVRTGPEFGCVLHRTSTEANIGQSPTWERQQ